MVYLDTGCLLKLYYPEAESAAVAGEGILFIPLHELEIATAILFRREAKPEQVAAVLALVNDDLGTGKLVETAVDWRTVFHASADLARKHAAETGCRSLDILHCALAEAAGSAVFLSSDRRQVTLARAQGLRVLAIQGEIAGE